MPLAGDDPWYQHPMLVPRTSADPTRTAEDANRPPTFVNIASQWWDGSQLYGSSLLEQERLRAFEGGRLALTESGLLPLDTDGRTELTGVTGNWWLGLSLMHTLFHREHNAICAMLSKAYPRWSDDMLFDHARLNQRGADGQDSHGRMDAGYPGHPSPAQGHAQQLVACSTSSSAAVTAGWALTTS